MDSSHFSPSNLNFTCQASTRKCLVLNGITDIICILTVVNVTQMGSRETDPIKQSTRLQRKCMVTKEKRFHSVICVEETKAKF